MEISIQNKKMELIQWLTTLNDEFMVQKLIDLKNQLKGNDVLLSDEMLKSIEKGIKDADAGILTPHKDAQAIYEKYL